MGDLTKNKAANALVWAAFFAFWLHSLHCCRAHRATERCVFDLCCLVDHNGPTISDGDVFIAANVARSPALVFFAAPSLFLRRRVSSRPSPKRRRSTEFFPFISRVASTLGRRSAPRPKRKIPARSARFSSERSPILRRTTFVRFLTSRCPTVQPKRFRRRFISVCAKFSIDRRPRFENDPKRNGKFKIKERPRIPK